jgi:hypothetical protein
MSFYNSLNKEGLNGKNGKLLVLLFNLICILTIRSGKYTPYIILIFFIFILLYYPTIKNKLIIFYCILFSFFFFYGILKLNDTYSILEDSFAFLPLILIFIYKTRLGIDLHKNLHLYLANSLVYLIPISGLIFNYMDYGFGSIITTRFNYNESTNFELFSPIFPILFAPYLVFYFNHYNRREKFLVNIANFSIVFMGIITLSRSVVISAILPYLILYSIYLFKSKIKFLKFLFVFFLIITTLIIFINSSLFTNSLFAVSVEGIQLRNENTYDRSDVTTGRYEETTDYLDNNLSFINFFIGKGLGGHKTNNDSDSYIGGPNMIHFGPMHVFMKGGIFLLFLLYFPLLYSIYYFWNTNYQHYSLIMLLFFLLNIQTTNWAWGYGTLFYWMTIGKLLEKLTFKKIINKEIAI